jgi:hypothetical protein
MERANSASVMENSEQPKVNDQKNSETGKPEEEKDESWQRFTELAKEVLGLDKDQVQRVIEKSPPPRKGN